MNRWIPVADRLPEPDKVVMASTEYDVFPEARYTKDYGWEWRYESGINGWLKINGVAAWQPWPEPYESEGGEHNDQV